MVKFPCVNITVKRDKVKLVDYKSIYNDNPACSVLQPDWLVQSRDLSVYFKLLGSGGDDLDRYNVRESKREGESSTCTLLPLPHSPLSSSPALLCGWVATDPSYIVVVFTDNRWLILFTTTTQLSKIQLSSEHSIVCTLINNYVYL